MQNHPIYKPKLNFYRLSKLKKSFFSDSFFVWKDFNLPPRKWKFYKNTKTLVILIEEQENVCKWGFFPNIKLVQIMSTYPELVEEGNYEVWENEDGNYIELRGDSGSIYYLMRANAVGEHIREHFEHLSLRDILIKENQKNMEETYERKSQKIALIYTAYYFFPWGLLVFLWMYYAEFGRLMKIPTAGVLSIAMYIYAFIQIRKTIIKLRSNYPNIQDKNANIINSPVGTFIESAQAFPILFVAYLFGLAYLFGKLGL